MTPDGTVTVLRAFACDSACVIQPAYLIEGRDGNLFGIGAVRNLTAVFKMSRHGVVTLLRQVDTTDGDYSTLGLPGFIQAADLSLYGTTRGHVKGARARAFAISRISPDGAVTVLHSFNPGDSTYSQLLQGNDGHFYGTFCCGDYSAGAVFRLRVFPDAPTGLTVTQSAAA
jgi:hypothetical protein